MNTMDTLPWPTPPLRRPPQDIIAGEANRTARALIDRWPDWPVPGVVLSGPPKSGKSFLARNWQRRAGAVDITGLSLDPDDLGGWAESAGSLLLDNAARFAADPVGERALFHILNLLMQRGAHILLVAEQPTAQWPVRLPDLRSRLALMPAAVIETPDDAMLAAYLRRAFDGLQVTVSDELIAYLVPRIERSYAAAQSIAEALENEARRQRRAVTRPFAVKFMKSDRAA